MFHCVAVDDAGLSGGYGSSRDLVFNSHWGHAYARITSASGCALSLLGKERLLATVAPPSDCTRIEVDRRKGLRTSKNDRSTILPRTTIFYPTLPYI